MPEGDTLHRLAASIRPHFQGEPVEGLTLRDRGEVSVVRGHPIDDIQVAGKHLLVIIDRRWTLHVHLGLRGRGRSLVPDATAAAATDAHATVSLRVPRRTLVITRSARHDLYGYRDMRLERILRALGPDLLAPTLDADAVVARARAPGYRDTVITDLLLDQRVAAGIGNVYRSELLFLARLFPWTPVGALDDATLHALFTHARTLMASNLGPGRRATVGPARGARRKPETPRLWVYRRAGRPCLRCSTVVERSIAGRTARATYWCPRCQARARTPPGP